MWLYFNYFFNGTGEQFVQFRAVVVHVVPERIQQSEDRTLYVCPDLYAADHSEPAERRHIRYHIVDVGEIRTIGIQRREVHAHAFSV